MDIVNEHENWRYYNCINLIPSENVTSPQVRALLSCDMGHRYTMPASAKVHGSVVENAYRGTKYTDEVEALCAETACRIFKAEHACVKPLSGHISAMISLVSALKKGDKYFAIGPENGGYDGYGSGYFAEMMSLKFTPIPFNKKRWNIDYVKTVKLIKHKKPNAIIVGASFILFPYDLDMLYDVCKKTGSTMMYDASHVLGLIAGSEFQPNPLEAGCDVIYGSTHKSFFGPQGGIVLTNDDSLWKKIQKNITWKTMDNAHWNRIAALAQAMSEMQTFGQSYARQTVSNARSLGKALNEQGFPIKYEELGFTDSHQLAIDVNGVHKNFGFEINELAKHLENNNIIIDAVGRIGTNEITRMGFKESDMNALAEIIVQAVKDKKDVRDKVKLLRAEREVEYCFK